MASEAGSARRGGAWAEVLGVAALVMGLVGALWAARGEPGMTWDEPYFFERSMQVGRWLGVLAGEGPARAFERGTLEDHWAFCRAVPDQHPPVPALLGLASEAATGWAVGPLRGYRLSTVALFALAAGVMFRFVRGRWGLVPALVAVGVLVSDPHPFIHAQLFTADSDTGVFWFLAALAHLRACETGRGAGWFGVWVGLAIMCKATGVLVIPAALLWGLLARPAGWWRPLAWGLATTPLTMVLANPAWWTAPAWGMTRWVRAFLDYPQKVPVYYLGRVYDSVQTFLPWHNTAVLTATMVPIGLLALAALAVPAAARPADGPGARVSGRAVAAWAWIHFLNYLVLRMFWFLPAHDGLRQVVPAFFFLPVLAAMGTAWLLRLAGGRGPARWGAAGLAVACVLASLAETVRVHPFEMSYYNALIGGPRGAMAAGMETTFFWDSATAEVLGWMNANLPRDSTVLIFPPPNVLTFGWEQRWGRLRPDLRMLNMDGPSAARKLALMGGPDPCYILFQNRQGLYMPAHPGQSDFFRRLVEGPTVYELAPARVDGVRLLGIVDQAGFRALAEGLRR